MIIGLTGAAGAGKDTAAEMLLSMLPDSISSSFAYPLYAAFDKMFPSLSHSVRTRASKEIPQDLLGGVSCRYALQTLGTEWGREMLSPDIWILSLLSRLEEIRFSHLIITDVRFPNEAEWVIRNRGQVWQLHREATFVDNPAHESEAGIPVDLLTRVVYNGGSFEDLRRELRFAATDLPVSNLPLCK